MMIGASQNFLRTRKNAQISLTIPIDYRLSSTAGAPNRPA